MKLEKSAQPVSPSPEAFGELQPLDSDTEAVELHTGALGAVELPVSIGMSSKFAVQTVPEPKQQRTRMFYQKQCLPISSP